VNLKTVISLLKQTFTEWQEDKAPTLAAALAYYTVFSLAPLLIIVIAIVGLVFGAEAAQGQIVAQLQSLIGKDGAQTQVGNDCYSSRYRYTFVGRVQRIY
jgi:membrane protein